MRIQNIIVSLKMSGEISFLDALQLAGVCFRPEIVNAMEKAGERRVKLIAPDLQKIVRSYARVDDLDETEREEKRKREQKIREICKAEFKNQPHLMRTSYEQIVLTGKRNRETVLPWQKVDTFAVELAQLNQMITHIPYRGK
jgi:hypothetical protein